MGKKETLEIIITAKDQTKGVFGNLKGGLGGIAKLGAAAAVTGIGAVAAGVAGLGVGITMLAKDAAKLGPIKEAFEGIAEASGQSADEILKSFKTQSKGMITNTDLMKNYNKAASLVSKQFANELPEAMGYLTKVAGATGEDMGFMMQSLITGVGRLQPLILDNLDIQVDLTKAYDDYALSLGKTTGELTKTEQQAGLMAQVMNLLAENTASMPDISDPFARLSATFTDLKDKVALAIGDTLLPLVEEMSLQIAEFVESEEFQAWLETTADWMKVNLIPIIKETAEWIGEKLPVAISNIQTAWLGIKPGLGEMWKSIIRIKDSIVILIEWIGRAIQRYNDWNTMLFTGGMTSWTSTGRPPGSKPKKPPGYNVKGIQNYQHGGSFMVGGPAGIDQTPVSFMATRGERVNIIPKGGGGAGMTLHLTYAPMISLGNREEMETQLGPFLDEALRRAGISQ